MKEELKKILDTFMNETAQERTTYTEEHDIPEERAPTFMEFIIWITERDY